jgi:glycosyltransferase involved in cell wall biosynthesis
MSDRPARLAVDASNLARDRRGMGRVARDILQTAFADRRFEVTLLVTRPDQQRALQAEYPQARVRFARSAARRRAFDVVWYPFNGMRFDAAAPTLVTINDAFAFTEPSPERIARWREQHPIRHAARRATRLSTISNWSRDQLVRVLRVDPARVRVVRPTPDSFWFPAFGERLPAPLAERNYVLLVGAREPRKNARMLIRACAQALRGPRETLVIVGELRAQDRQLAAELRVPAGEIAAASDELLRALYRNAGAVAVPSLAEGFGLVAAEAMACGAPVIAADAAALPEATAGAAQLLDPFDTDAWARAIRTLFDDPAYAALLRERSVTRFAAADRHASARLFLELLRELAGGGART